MNARPVGVGYGVFLVRVHVSEDIFRYLDPATQPRPDLLSLLTYVEPTAAHAIGAGEA